MYTDGHFWQISNDRLLTLDPHLTVLIYLTKPNFTPLLYLNPPSAAPFAYSLKTWSIAAVAIHAISTLPSQSILNDPPNLAVVLSLMH